MEDNRSLLLKEQNLSLNIRDIFRLQDIKAFLTMSYSARRSSSISPLFRAINKEGTKMAQVEGSVHHQEL
jgi:hypothetical protein